MVFYPQGLGSAGSSGSITVSDSHVFADTTARDAYFASHASELVNDLYIYITAGTLLQQYNLDTTSWIDRTPVVRGPTGPTGATGPDGQSINVTVSEEPPSSPQNGDIWVDSNADPLVEPYNPNIQAHISSTHASPSLRAPHDVTVYKSGSTYYAVSSSGAAISSGTDASTVLTAAIAGLPSNAFTYDPSYPDHGTVFVKSGIYNLLTTINVPRSVRIIFDIGAHIRIGRNVEGFMLSEYSGIEGGIFDCSSVWSSDGETEVTYTHTVFTFSGNTPVWRHSGGYLRNVEIRNWNESEGIGPYNGTAISLSSTHATAGKIWGVIIENIKIDGFLYGIHLYRTGASFGANWINGCKIRNIKMDQTRRAVWFETDTEDTSDFVANLFDGLEIQTGDRVLADGPVITITGDLNWFRNTNVWDWDLSWGPCIVLDAYSTYTLYEYMRCDLAAGYITDSGKSNLLVNQYGAIQQNGVIPQLGQRYHLNQVLTSAGAGVTIQSNSAVVDFGVTAGQGYHNIINVYCTGSETKIVIAYSKTNSCGIFQVYINDTRDSSATYDHYASTASINYTEITLTVALRKGWNKIDFIASSKNASSSSYFFMLRWLRLQ